MTTTTARIAGQSLAYLDAGPPDAPALLFLHGAFINKEYWSAQIDYFSPRYRTLAPDLPGHGGSSAPAGDQRIEGYGEAIVNLIRSLDLAKVILVGHSFGTDVMLEAAVRDPARILGLVAVDHLKHVGQEVPRAATQQLIEGLRTNFTATCAHYARQALVTEATDEALVARLLDDFSRMDRSVGVALFQRSLGYTARQVDLLRRVPHHLNLLHVDYSPTDEQALRQHLGDRYTLHPLSGSCHYPMVEHPARFNAALGEILATIEL